MSDSEPAKLPYYIRPLEHRDIARAVDVLIPSFIDDELQGWINPKRREYPLAFRATFVARLHKRLTDQGTWPIVCVPSSHAYDHDKIMGVAVWERYPGTSKPGSNEAEKDTQKQHDVWYQNNTGWFVALEKKLLKVATKWDEKLRLNQATDYDALQEFIDTAGDDETVFRPIYSDVRHWHLAVVGVDPQYQRKGVATELVRWGMKLAEEESKSMSYSVPVTLTASAVGYRLYQRLGFKCVDWVKVPDWFRTLNEEGRAFVWDPQDTWIEDAPEGSTVDGRKITAVWTERALAMLEKPTP